MFVLFFCLLFFLCKRKYDDYRLENYGIPLKAVVLRNANIHFKSSNHPGYEYQYRYKGGKRYDRYSEYMFKKGTKVGDTIDIIIDPENPNRSIPVK